MTHISLYDHETRQGALCYTSMDIYAEPSLSREKKNLKGFVIIEERLFRIQINGAHGVLQKRNKIEARLKATSHF